MAGEKVAYVYVDYRGDTGVPFYVGKGNKHRIKVFKRNQVWCRIFAKHGVIRTIVLETTDHDAVLEEEQRLIKVLHTRNYEGGANLTDGGEGSLGWRPTKETRAKMRAKRLGLVFSAEHKQKLSEAHLRRYLNSEERAKTGQHSKNVWNSPGYRERISQGRMGAGNNNASLTEQDVVLIRNEWAAYDSSLRGQTKAFCVKWASKLNVTSVTIYGIITRKTWKNLP